MQNETFKVPLLQICSKFHVPWSCNIFNHERDSVVSQPRRENHRPRWRCASKEISKLVPIFLFGWRTSPVWPWNDRVHSSSNSQIFAASTAFYRLCSKDFSNWLVKAKISIASIVSMHLQQVKWPRYPLHVPYNKKCCNCRREWTQSYQNLLESVSHSSASGWKELRGVGNCKNFGCTRSYIISTLREQSTAWTNIGWSCKYIRCVTFPLRTSMIWTTVCHRKRPSPCVHFLIVDKLRSAS